MRRLATACLLALSAVSALATAQTVSEYRGLCDASAAVALGGEHFVVADDERNTLQVYQRGAASPVASRDVSAFLGTAADKESDIEGAATVGTRIYWISSHGRNARGKVQERRLRFFATEVDAGTAPPSIRPVGMPYSGLLEDLIAAPGLTAYGLGKASRLAPEAPGGLNIEGLAATGQGGLLIGFRNPVVNGKALVVPLNNPGDVVAGRKARLGVPTVLDLGGVGIRSIERVASGYLIVAGPPDDDGRFLLYRWTGNSADAAVRIDIVEFTPLRPEALFEIPGKGQIQVLSDDGGIELNGKACKKHPAAERAFRSVILTTP